MQSGESRVHYIAYLVHEGALAKRQTGISSGTHRSHIEVNLREIRDESV